MSVKVENRQISQCEAVALAVRLRQELEDFVRKDFGMKNLLLESELYSDEEKISAFEISSKNKGVVDLIVKSLGQSPVIESNSVVARQSVSTREVIVSFKLKDYGKVDDKIRFFWDASTVEDIKSTILNLARNIVCSAYSAHEYEKRTEARNIVTFKRRFELICKAVELSDALQCEMTHIALMSKTMTKRCSYLSLQVGKLRRTLRNWRNKSLDDCKRFLGESVANSLGEKEILENNDIDFTPPFILEMMNSNEIKIR